MQCVIPTMFVLSLAFSGFFKRSIYLRILKLIYIHERNVKKKIAYFDIFKIIPEEEN